MAEREAVAGKMKLIMSYQDDAGTWKERQVNLANLKANMEPTDLSAVAAAFGTLQEDAVKEVHEIIESRISG